MDQQNSRPNNDPRANRLPYHPEARPGRFGRVDNWREAEEKKIEELRQRRKAASRSANRQTGPQRRASSYRPSSQISGQQPRVGSSTSAQAGASRQNSQQDSADAASARQREEVQPWQQGRFGRVENWREVEERRRAEEQRLEQQREAMRQARRQKALAAKQKQAAQQQAAQQQAAKQRLHQQAQAAQQAQAGAHTKERALDSQQNSEDYEDFVSKHPTHVPVMLVADVPDDEIIDASGEINSAYDAEAVKQAAKSYARESYGSAKPKKEITFNAQGTRSAMSKYERRPNSDTKFGRSKAAHSAKGGTRSKISDLSSRISPKLIAIVAAVLIVIIAIGAFVSFTQPGNGSTGAGQGTREPSLPTPIMSESSGITMHSAVAMEDLTEVLIHNASYAYANEITTQLTEATNTDVIAAHGTGRVVSEQPTGDKWMTGEFIRCFRSGNAGPIMSAIDCGGPVGATVYAPVTGEVVLVKQYKLYGEIDDYRVHIQPTGRPDLDVVLIHLTDVTVKAGDKVTAGVTPIAKIRDIYQYLDESLQLKNYTAEDDNGNHTHIQVNNAMHPEYTALDELKPPAAAAGVAVSE